MKRRKENPAKMKDSKFEKMKSLEENRKKFLKFKNYFILVAIRFFLALLPETGYVHPDEFFQSTEVLAGDIFELDVVRAWEFNTSFPLRSVSVPIITVGLPYGILKWTSTLTNLIFGIDLLTPYTLLILPRLMTTILSLISDYSLWHMCQTYGQNYMPRLVVFASSYVILIFASRTFSNTVEMILFSILLALVLDTMHYSDEVVWREDMILNKYEKIGRDHPVERARLTRLRSSLPKHSLRHCPWIAIVTVIGIFNRPTFLAFAFPSLFSWLHRGMGSKAIGWSHFHIRVLALSVYGMLTAFLLIVIDSGYYGYLTVAEIFAFQISITRNFVVTPLNFLLYNSQTSNLANHGLHPRWLHALVNLPLMFHILGIATVVSIFSFIKLLIRRKWTLLPKAQSITALMYASFIVPLLGLSMFPHQEPRFLLPLIIPITFLHAQTLRLNNRFLMPLWYSLNIIGLLFYGFIHQGGVWGLLVHLHESGLAHPAPLNSVHIISTHVYPIPKFPLLLPSTSKTLLGPGGRRYRATRRVHIYDTGTSETLGLDTAHAILNQCVKDWKNHRLKCHVYSVYPGTLQDEFSNALFHFNITQSIDNKIFYLHLSTEAMPKIEGGFCTNSCSTFQSFITNKLQELGLVLSQIKLAAVT